MHVPHDPAVPVSRPNIVKLGIAILAALYAFGLARSVLAGGLEPQHLPRVLPGLIAMPILLAGAWAGVGAARWMLALVFALDVFVQAWLSLRYARPAGAATLAFYFLHLVGIGTLFVHSSHAWFRARGEARRRHPMYAAWVAAGFVLGLPLAFWVLAMRPGLNLTDVGMMALMAVMYFFYVPAIIFGRPHFMFGIGAGPATATGWVLTVAFWLLVLLVLAAIWWALRRVPAQPAPREEPAPARSGRRAASIFAVAIVAAVAAIAVPLARDRSALDDKLQEKIASEQRKADAALADYPELEGNFVIENNGGHYAVRSFGRWKLSKARLEIVAENTTIRPQFADCAECPKLKHWHFELRGDRTSKGPWLSGERAGFEPIAPRFEGPYGGRISANDHRMSVAIAQEEEVMVHEGDKRAVGRISKPLPASGLADYWLGLHLEYEGNSNYPMSARNPFMFLDALAARGLVPPRCAAPVSVADAVQRGCAAELARMLGDPVHAAAVEKGDESYRVYPASATPLEVAIWQGDARSAELLLEHGADANAEGWMGHTRLMDAVLGKSPEVVAALLRHKPRLDVQYGKYESWDKGKTALIMAAADSKTEMVKALVAAGADKSLKDRHGHTALDYALQRRNEEAAAALK